MTSSLTVLRPVLFRLRRYLAQHCWWAPHRAERRALVPSSVECGRRASVLGQNARRPRKRPPDRSHLVSPGSIPCGPAAPLTRSPRGVVGPSVASRSLRRSEDPCWLVPQLMFAAPGGVARMNFSSFPSVPRGVRPVAGRRRGLIRRSSRTVASGLRVCPKASSHSSGSHIETFDPSRFS